MIKQARLITSSDIEIAIDKTIRVKNGLSMVLFSRPISELRDLDFDEKKLVYFKWNSFKKKNKQRIVLDMIKILKVYRISKHASYFNYILLKFMIFELTIYQKKRFEFSFQSYKAYPIILSIQKFMKLVINNTKWLK